VHSDLEPRVGREVGLLARLIELNSVDLSELLQAKHRYETMLNADNVDQFVFRAFRTKTVPAVACAEVFAPNKDLFGTPIQDGKQIVEPMQWISLTILPTPPNGGLGVIGSAQQNDVFNSFAESRPVGRTAPRPRRCP